MSDNDCLDNLLQKNSTFEMAANSQIVDQKTPRFQKGSKTTNGLESELLYSIEDNPPWHMSFFLGLQHLLTLSGGLLAIPIMLSPLMCIEEGDPARSALISTTFFISGLNTFLQATFGVRLPIVQGGSIAFLVPTVIILTTHFEPCSALDERNMTSPEREEQWQIRMREVQGSIMVSSLLEMFIGWTGLIGLLLRWITPLAIAPTIALVGLSCFDVAANMASTHWGIALITILLIVIFSQYMKNIPLLWPTYAKSSGFSFTRIYIFQLFPVLIAVSVSWGICSILTQTGVFPEGSNARTDRHPDLLTNSPWFRVPYPGQWGTPTVSLAGILGLFAGVVASIIESIGDYYACATIAGAPPPPVHAINRGISTEGIGCFIAGLWGTGCGTTSVSQNIAAIGITKVGSRRVVQCCALILIMFGLLGKIGAVFVSIPEPVIGGMFCTLFAVITAVGLSSLQNVNLSSSRNMFVLGCSLFFGLAFPKWLAANQDFIQTGSAVVDQILTVLLQTPMLVGGVIGFTLDNTIPGTPEERGLLEWDTYKNQEKKLEEKEGDSDKSKSCYDLPFGMDLIKRTSWMRYVPVSPTFCEIRERNITKKSSV